MASTTSAIRGTELVKYFTLYTDINGTEWWLNPEHIVAFNHPQQFKPSPGERPLLDIYTTSSGNKPLLTVRGDIVMEMEDAAIALGWVKTEDEEQADATRE